tara:strand:- start:679 stop:1572 length:894 start_codon:yes stop_codon:yes gene_type:complete
MSKVWALKHRPNLHEIIGQDHIFDNAMDSNKQHYILYSSGAGTGKTSLAHALAEEWGYVLHEYNASSKKTRGIEFVEEELLPMSRNGRYTQVFLLDEADQLTAAAQSALKGVIENAQGYFILTCNDLSKISAYLKSRCRILEFLPITIEDMVDRLEVISGREGVEVRRSQLEIIAKIHKGDLRAAINLLQAFAQSENKDKFLIDAGVRVGGWDNWKGKEFLTLCFRDKDFEGGYKQLLKETKPRQVIKTIFDTAMSSETATPAQKMIVVKATINAERDFVSGVESKAIVGNFVRELC